MNVKKGKNINQIKLSDSLTSIIEQKEEFNTKLKNHILENYYTEYLILKTIFENYK